MVLYAVAAAKVPIMEHRTASVRCGEDGEPTTGEPSWAPSTVNIAIVAFPSSVAVALPNRNAGRAMRITPASEMRPEKASWIRYGSCKKGQLPLLCFP